MSGADVRVPAYETRWWGWGERSVTRELPPEALGMLRDELGEGEPASPVELDEVAIPDGRPVPEPVLRAVGEEHVILDRELRVRHAAGASYPDTLRLRTGRLERAPDAVIRPADHTQVLAVLEACSSEGVAVVPFGGGTSVVGGVEPLAGRHERVVSLDLGRLRHVEVDEVSLTGRLGPGLRGPEAEAALARRGLTLGHFPQSFEYATIGGFCATRSAGQSSSGYGRFDAMVTGLRLATPVGELGTLETPHTAAGPSIRELVIGSEGVLGAITDVSVRLRPAPERRHYEGWALRDLDQGLEAVRSLAQAGALPTVARLSDEEETRVFSALSTAPAVAKRLLGLWLAARRRRDGCMLICGYESDVEGVERARGRAARILRDSGAASLGSAPGRAWAHGRFKGPYLRDALMDRGIFVETLETSHTWSRLRELYQGVRGAISGTLEAGGTPGIVMCHVSHAYADGASLYFTFLARARSGEELEQWREVKAAACEAIVSVGGTITHHHAVGTDHAPYMNAEVGALGVEALRAVKERLDPAGVMNPGKLLPS